jgi:hypothetical protein
MHDFSDYQLVNLFGFLNHFHIKHIILHLRAMVLLVWTEIFERFNDRKLNSIAELIRQLGHR